MHSVTHVFALFVIVLSPLNCEADFKAYWNVPMNQCTRKGVHFDLDKYNIIHNAGNSFYGEKINIMYQPGMFPRYTTDGAINGGIPQLADLNLHRNTFLNQLNTTVKDAFEGPLILDFEEYLPEFDTVMPEVYREKSIELERDLHPDWPTSEVWQKAAKRFNKKVKPLFESLLEIGRELRPDTLLGYYHYPYCKNRQEPCDTCAPKMIALNDALKEWMYSISSALYPSLYTFEDGFRAIYRANIMSTRMLETRRINDNGLPILPYYWYRFKDSPNYLPRTVALSILWAVKHYEGDGIVIWGASKDLDTHEECQNFKEYVEETLGPLLHCVDQLPETLVQFLRDRYPLLKGDGKDGAWFRYIGARQNEQHALTILSRYCSNINRIL